MSFSKQKDNSVIKQIEKTNEDIKEGLRDLNHAHDVSDHTSKSLYEQNEKIDNIINNVDQSQQSANNSLYLTRGLKSFWGQVVNYFTKPKQVEEDTNIKEIQTQQMLNNQRDMNVQHEQAKQASYARPVSYNPTIQEQNDLLAEMNNQVERLKYKQQNINSELRLQNQKLEKLNDKEDNLQNSVSKLGKEIKKI